MQTIVEVNVLDGKVTHRPMTEEELAAIYVPSAAEHQTEIVRAVQAHLDDTAKSLGYDDIKSAVTYADEPAVRKFQTEGQALRAWRSLVWDKCYSELALVQSGQRAMPTPEQAVAELPVFVPPEEVAE